MPEIILDDHPNDIGWIRSIMLFPNDEQLRNQNFAVEVAKYEIANTEHLTEIWIQSKTNELKLRLTNECIRLLIEAPSDNELKVIREINTKQGIVAGHILASIYLMDKFKLEEPSMRKAIFVAKQFASKNKYGDGTPMHYSESKIEQYWQEYQPVSHLWAAFAINQAYPFVPTPIDCFSETGFATFLRVAAAMHEFGINFIPKRARPKEALLDSETCWRLPEEIKPMHLNSTNNPEKLIKLLKKYKAPKTQP